MFIAHVSKYHAHPNDRLYSWYGRLSSPHIWEVSLLSFPSLSLILVLLLAEALIQWFYSSVRNTRHCNNEHK